MGTPRTLLEQLLRDEGEVLHAYQDSRTFWTIGVGRLIDKRKGGGISHDEAMHLLDNDIAKVRGAVMARFPWAVDIDPVRLDVLHAMCFQMGIVGLAGFKTTLRMVEAGQYSAAAKQMLKSLWAKQTPERAQRLARQMETGERQ